MSTFHLKIVTPKKLFWDGEVDLVVVHTIEGDIGIRANHVNYISTLDIGKIKIQIGKEKKEASISRGMILVSQEGTTIVAATALWPEEVDVERAMNSKQKAEKQLQQYKRGDKEFNIATIHLKKAMVRMSLKNK